MNNSINIHDILANFTSSGNNPAPYIPQTSTGVQLVTDTVESKFAKYNPVIFNGTKHPIRFFGFIDGNNMPLSPNYVVCYDRKKEGHCIRPDINIRCMPIMEIPVNQVLTCMESKMKAFSTANGALPISQYYANCTSVPNWTNYDIIIGSEYWVDNVTKMPEHNYTAFKDRLYVPIPLFRTSDDKEPIGTYALKKRFLYNPADYCFNQVNNFQNFSKYNILECLCRYKNSIYSQSQYTKRLEDLVMQPLLRVNM